MTSIHTAFAALADKLGVATDVLWAALIRQAAIDGTVMLVQCLLFLVAFGVYVRWIIRDPGDIDYDARDVRQAVIIIGGITSVIGLALVILAINDIIAAFLNPEYWALHKVMKLLQGTMK